MPVQGSFHPSYLSNPHLYNLSTECYGGTVKGDTKVKVSDTHFSPLVHRDSHLAIKGIQVGLALFAFGKSSLTVLFFVLHVLEYGFWDDLLHNLPGN